MVTATPVPQAHTGIAGLDDILRGGLPRNCMFLIAGSPGSGKTTLAMQFLLEGIKNGEVCQYVSLAETRAEIENVAMSHGWDLSKLEITELGNLERRSFERVSRCGCDEGQDDDYGSHVRFTEWSSRASSVTGGGANDRCAASRTGNPLPAPGRCSGRTSAGSGR